MTLLYDRERGRICCRWKEPATMRFQGREVVINRQRTGSVRVSELGTMNKRDFATIRKGGRGKAVSQFVKALQRSGVFTKDYAPEVCEICGGSRGVRACFHPETHRLAWLCPEHDTVLSGQQTVAA
ncbi:hypothetical protein GGQ74_001277 [Desulfobaculum xiamenense]|uniref:Uncharacterized protein n=1 Tax=Desulfobaculum xiamenense TaxID=995050 RepID=A0A846QKG6_9BACT|nr:hypothetical protein [Desulfobaculum xiamenense]NJB67637.1 hypothetical protein [Desulfobaculum xiamenense]